LKKSNESEFPTGGGGGGGSTLIDKLNDHIHELKLKLGVVFRYQSSSLYDDLSVFYPPITGLPVPVIVFNNTEPQKTYTAGISGQISYTYPLTNKISIGILGGYQFDTNGDNISQLSILTGFRFL
jgi:hypothetical protein